LDQLKKYFSNPDSLISMFLGLAVVVVVAMLVVNYIRGQNTAEITNEAAQEEQAASGSANLPATHTVEAGESLWTIAQNTIGSGYNWVDIARANNLTDPNVITAGTKLTIPKVEKREPGQVTSATVAVNRPADGKYTVKHGDTLWSISMAVYGTGYRWSEIANMNKLTHPNVIHAGNVLMLP